MRIVAFLVLLIISIPSSVNASGGECVTDIGSAGGAPSISGSGDVLTPILVNIQPDEVLPLGSLAKIIENAGEELPEDAGTGSVLVLIVDDFSNRIGQRTHGQYVTEVATLAYHSIYSGHGIEVRLADYANPELLATMALTEPTVDSAIEAMKIALDLPVDKSIYKTLIFNWSWVILPCVQSVKISLPENLADFFDNVNGNEVEFYYDMSEYYNKRLGNLGELDYALTLVDYVIVNRLNPEEFNPNLISEYNPELIYELRAEVSSAFGELYFEREYTIGEFEELAGLVTGNIEPLSQYENLELILPIAASGNNGNTNETQAPAQWQEVLAVSGHWVNSSFDPTNVTPLSIWSSSNAGQVSGPSAWHSTISEEYIAGTSFSTPLVTILAAFVDYFDKNCDLSSLVDPTSGLSKDANKEFSRTLLQCSTSPQFTSP